MVQNRRSAAAGMENPSWGTSRSRKVRTKPLLHSKLRRSEPARNDLGSPPRAQSVLHGAAPAPSSPPPAPGGGSRERRLPRLARAEEGDDRIFPERSANGPFQPGSREHVRIISLKLQNESFEFQ